MKLFWLLVCLQVGIFALAFLSDLIWTRRAKASAHRPGVDCQDCVHGNLAVEVSGLWIHQYRDRWISCNAKKQQKMLAAEIKGDVATPLAEAVASSQIA